VTEDVTGNAAGGLRILVVEDEASYREPLTYQLAREGFDVVAVASGPEGLAAYDDGGADLVLLDLMLPGLSGTEVCRELRRRGDVPVIMLTAKDSEIDKVVGLEIGADDYVTKPYSFRELLARIRAVLRRRTAAGAPAADESAGGATGETSGDAPGGRRPGDAPVLFDGDDDVLRGGPVVMDVDRHEVTVRGEPVAFPLKEFELLEVLLRNVGRVLTRHRLIDLIWGSDYVGDTKTLDVHVKRIRTKIEDDPSKPALIVTVRGLGYKFTD
jgi:two-component system response regulator RegX3